MDSSNVICYEAAIISIQSAPKWDDCATVGKFAADFQTREKNLGMVPWRPKRQPLSLDKLFLNLVAYL